MNVSLEKVNYISVYSTLRKTQTVQEKYWTAWPLKMGPRVCSETPVTSYQSTLRNILEERSSPRQWREVTQDFCNLHNKMPLGWWRLQKSCGQGT